MLKHIDPEHVLFLDIETVPAHAEFDELDADWQYLWEEKTAFLRKRDEISIEDSYERAGIYAEFGKIVCISVGFLRQRQGDRVFRTTSFFGDDERQLLQEFSNLLNNHYQERHHLLCAHNGKEFDFPYICRRLIIQGLPIPEILNIAGKKPWEVRHLDTMELWKFGDYKNYTSLKLLTKVFGIPTPKDDIDGGQVADVYYNEKNLDRIEVYCRKDVLALTQLFLRYRGDELLTEDQVLEV
jgi:uncharacterized protein YprB with RNaseH-like and TPR domain